MDIFDTLRHGEETLWLNPDLISVAPNQKFGKYWFVYVKAAQNRYMRFLPFTAKAFPETAAKKGLIESNLLGIPDMEAWLNENGADIQGRLILKDDAHLPVVGSIKGRGGMNAVFQIAEHLMQKHKMLLPTENYEKILTPEFRDFFSQYTIETVSRGNLGLSVARTAAAMGFHVVIHIPSNTVPWKKELLNQEGENVKVYEYEQDFDSLVTECRRESDEDPHIFFIDPVNSEELFFGYSTAAMRLRSQLRHTNIPVDSEHPLFVYIPCGVGSAAAGITFGLKQLCNDNVHCFFVEPTEAPSMTLGLASGKFDKISVEEFGLTGCSTADALSANRPSRFACELIAPQVSGICTANDAHMSEYREKLQELEDLHLEISACAGFQSVAQICRPGSAWDSYLERHQLKPYMNQATHIVWATGGGLMPEI